jgi:hypothetical protein
MGIESARVIEMRKLLISLAAKNARNADSASLCTNLYKNRGRNQAGVAEENRGSFRAGVGQIITAGQSTS